MTTPDSHPREALQERLDGRLDAERAAEVDAHLSECAACRDEWAALAALRDALRAALPSSPLPDDLLADVRAALDREETAAELGAGPEAGPQAAAPPASMPAVGRARPWRAAAGWAAAAAAVLVVAVYLLRPTAPALPDLFEAAHRSAADLRPPLGLATADAGELQTWFDDNLPFAVHVYDLAMMGYRLVGGRIDTVGERPSAVLFYRDAAGRTWLCHMLLAHVDELPTAAERRVHDGIPFFIYRRGAITIVAWPEGKMICALTSDAPSEAVIELALAKAVKT